MPEFPTVARFSHAAGPEVLVTDDGKGTRLISPNHRRLSYTRAEARSLAVALNEAADWCTRAERIGSTSDERKTDA